MSYAEPHPVIIRGDARCLPLPDESVDLIVTSPPYWSLRSYTDGGEHYAEQIGSEPTWQEYLDNLIACTREWMRVLKPGGSMWVNLGDKYAGDPSGPQGKSGARATVEQSRTYAGLRDRQRATDMVSRPKSLLLLPHRYAIRCADDLGLTVRQDQVWSKVNGLPESVTDRTRRSHEYLFHLTKRPTYYSAVDEIRIPHRPVSIARSGRNRNVGDEFSITSPNTLDPAQACNPLGALPGSVWEIASQPLNVPDHVAHARCCGGHRREGCEDGLDHFAAFPFALVRPIIQGWSPREVCTVCGEGRRPVVDVRTTGHDNNDHAGRIRSTVGLRGDDYRQWRTDNPRSVTGYACACPDDTAPSTPGIVLDPFGGTSSAALVAAMHGRVGISCDLSMDYGRLAQWRSGDPKERARAAGLDPDAVAKVRTPLPGQANIFDDLGEVPA